jgi:methionine-rich copper-binding protein CopC
MHRNLYRAATYSALAISLLMPQLALAHAVLVDSTPKVDETIHGSSLRVDLKFNSRVDGTRSVVQLAMSDGSVRSLDLAGQAQPDEIVTHAEGLGSGKYTLRWQALSSDGHMTRGEIPFKVVE